MVSPNEKFKFFFCNKITSFYDKCNLLTKTSKYCIATRKKCQGSILNVLKSIKICIFYPV